MRLSLIIVSLLVPALCCAEPTTSFQAKLHRHKSPHNRVLVDKVGTLTFDNDNRKLTFKGDAHEKLEIPYDAVTKVVFEVTTHMRGALPQLLTATGFPGLIAGKAIARQHVHNYWFYLERDDNKQAEKVLLEVPSDSSTNVIDEAKKVFGSRVLLANYPENGEQLDPAKLPAAKSKDILRINRRDHPLPQLKTDKALVMVVCPALAARYAGRGRTQFRLHANEKVIAVNKQGTYSFAFLDPGKYRLVSQSENAYGFDVELEAGKSYYFLQNTFDGIFKRETSLSRNSPELVMYLLDGSYYADWKPK